MRVVVTGASGLVGGNLALELLARGHEVRATRRAASKTEHLAGRGIEWVAADLSNVEELTSAFRGASVVFHCAALVTARRKPTPQIIATNVDGTRNVVQAAAAAGIDRLVHCSTVNAVGLSEDGRPCTEQARWNFAEQGVTDGYTITKHQAEEVLMREGGSLDWVIVNPTYMFGPNDTRPSSGKLIVDVARGRVPGWPPGTNNFVDVRDVARGMVLAQEKGRRGERYILGGDNLPYRAIMEQIARLAGVSPPSRPLPRMAATLLGYLGDLQESLFDREPLINSATVKFAFCSSFQFSSEKAERELGYTHGPLDPAIADALAYFRSAGMLA